MTRDERTRRTGGAARAVAVAALLVAFAFRLVGIERFPPGLYRDEAYYALDALRILDGARPAYLTANNGREPLYSYLSAAPIALLGRSPVAARLASVWVGTAAVAAVFAAGSVVAGRRRGAFAASLMAVLPWSVMLGRLGLRAGTLPLVMCMAIAATWVGVRRAGGARGRGLAWLAFGGALAGLALYTYTAVRVAPLMILAVAAWWLMRPAARPDLARARRAAAVWIGAAALVALPLGVAAARSPEVVLGRPAQVAVARGQSSSGRAEAVARNAVAVAGMFAVRGDNIARHNRPGWPVFAPAAALLFFVGLGTLLARWRRGANVFLLAWLGVMLVPTLLAEDAPHYLRAVGALPPTVIVAGIGLWALAELAPRPLIVAAVIGGTAVAFEASRSWQLVTQVSADVAYLFETGASDLAVHVNRDLGSGWQGGWAEAQASRVGTHAEPELGAPEGQHVWLDRRLRDGWAAVPYLVPEERVTLTDPYDPILSEPGAAYLWPWELELPEVWAKAAPLGIQIAPGALERGDLEPEARLMYAVARGERVEGAGDKVASFGNGLSLASAAVRETPDGIAVTTEWDARAAVPAPATLSVQVLEGDRVVAAADAPLGQGEWPSSVLPSDLFPSDLWRAGQRVREVRRLDVPGGLTEGRRVVIALYDWADGQRNDVEVIGDAPEGGFDRVRIWPVSTH